MAVSFCFLKGDQPVDLDRVDKEVCEFTGEPYDEKEFSYAFQFLTTAGVSIVIRSGGYRATQEGLDKYLEDFFEEGDDEKWRQEVTTLLQKFLIDDYTFESWR